MKESFKRDMRLIYPDECGDISLYQLRDLCRTYLMGWCSALMSLVAKDAVEAWVKEFRSITDPNWWPDKSWMWW